MAHVTSATGTYCLMPAMPALEFSRTYRLHAGNTTIVGVGGRYDALLRNRWPPTALAHVPAPGAVGATLNVERLAKMVEQRRQGSAISASQADVLVCSKATDSQLQVGAWGMGTWVMGSANKTCPHSTPGDVVCSSAHSCYF